MNRATFVNNLSTLKKILHKILIDYPPTVQKNEVSRMIALARNRDDLRLQKAKKKLRDNDIQGAYDSFFDSMRNSSQETIINEILNLDLRYRQLYNAYILMNIAKSDLIRREQHQSIGKNQAVVSEKITELPDNLSQLNSSHLPLTRRGIGWYHPAPSREGSFLVKQATQSRIPNESVYEIFFLDQEGKSIEFEIIQDDKTITTAIKAPEQYIEGVCASINDHTPNAKKIITKERGLAYKENHTWKIKKRAIIKYE